MQRQFHRQFRLLLGKSAETGLLLTSEDISTDPAIRGLRMTFDIDKDTTKESNKSEIKIWNLSDASLELIQKEDLMIELSVGYRDDLGPVRIFIGTLINCTTKAEDGIKDIVTTIACSDGQLAVRDSILSDSFPPGTDSLVILKATANKMGLALDVANDVKGITYKDGYSFVGYGAKSLDVICSAMGASWSIQNNVLQVIMRNGVTRKQGIVFSPMTGLIGSPERVIRSSKMSNNTKEGEKQEIINEVGMSKRQRKQRKARRQKKRKKTSQAGYRIKTLLAPTVNPGDAIRIESNSVCGWFRVESIKHSGGTFESEWISEIECIEVLLDERQSEDNSA